MILAIDVHYKEQYAKIVGVIFEWNDGTPRKIYTTTLTGVAPYVPGKFYQRELPCILKLLEQIPLEALETIIVDGHCYINNEGDHGLGGYLWTALDRQVPIIGLAKNKLDGNDQFSFPIYRGNSKKALFVSTIGTDPKCAMERIVEMKEDYRMPAVLKELDRITKEE